MAELRDLHAISQDFNVDMPPELAAELEEPSAELEEPPAEGEAVAAAQQTSDDADHAQGKIAEDLVKIDEDEGDLERIGGNFPEGSDVAEDRPEASLTGGEQELDHIDADQQVEMHATGASEAGKPLNC